jgi:glyoxalase family protein
MADSPILGLHHVTATVDDAQADLNFAAGTLGLRLVKKTVNFDNHHVYHFYYGDEHGTPGTIWTTFPYKGRGVRAGTKGAGQITVTSFSVPRGSLAAWERRLRDQKIPVQDGVARFGEESLVFSDPSGLTIELVGTDRDQRQPWTSGSVPAADAVRGLHSVTLSVRAPGPTVEFMTDVLGFSIVNEIEGRLRLAVNGDQPGQTMEVVHGKDAVRAINGLGTVHHVAMAVENGDEQIRMQRRLLRLGYQVTEVRDRQYFTSIYFFEPGGVLFEIATVPPGFLIDEALSSLGRDLKLPPWEEPNRQDIESGLATVSAP